MSTPHQPLIRILLATYNGEKYLAGQINSIIAQNYQNWTLVLHDDASTDDTLDIIYRYIKMLPKKISCMDDGLSFGSAKDNFMHLLLHTTLNADIFCLCDQDDIWHPNKLTSIVNEYVRLNDENPILIHTDLSIVDQNLLILDSSHNHLLNNQKYRINKYSVLYGNPIPGCSMAFNSKILALLFDDRRIIMHDWWILLIALYNNASIVYIDTPLVKYRQHSGNVCGHQKLSFLVRIYRLLLRLPKYYKNARLAYAQSIIFFKQPFVFYLLARIAYQVKVNF